MDTKKIMVILIGMACMPMARGQNIGFGTNQPQTIIDLNGDLAIRATALELTNGTHNAVNVSARFSSFRITGPTAAFTIGGLSAGSEGRLVTLFNRSGHTLTLTNETAEATAANRIITGTNAGLTLPANASVQLQYDQTLSRWVVRNHSAPPAGAAISGGWGLLGNALTTANNFVGTTDGAPLTLKQNSTTVGYFAGNNVLLGINAGQGFESGNNNAFILGKMRSPLTATQYSVAIGTDAEISGDYQIMIGAPYHKTGVGLGYNEGPTHTLTVGRKYGNEGALAIYGTGNYHSHFNYSNTEDTYIRGGKLLSKVYINDGNGGDVILGSPTTSSVGIGTNYPLGYAKLEVKTQPETRGLAVGDGTIGMVHFLGGAGRGLNGVGGYFGTSSNHPLHFYTNSQFAQMTLLQNGALCIGSMYGATGYKLNVAGKIMAEEIRVQSLATWPDYVFKPGYALMPLPLLEAQIEKQGHLPGIPNAETIAREGITLGNMQTRMMEKIEELTLHLIQLDKDNKALKQAITELKAGRK
ncbi:MAG: hypothetical protein MUF24_09935 [Chitinophagaceae bacterium]|nr:hypothetical protein [Chitinophagaceae bacterium]